MNAPFPSYIRSVSRVLIQRVNALLTVLRFLFPLCVSSHQRIRSFSGSTARSSRPSIAKTKLRPLGGFAAETGTTAGVGATRRVSAVRWGVARRIVRAWVLTIPAAGAIGAATYRLVRFGMP
jgi:Phosphate transporter family